MIRLLFMVLALMLSICPARAETDVDLSKFARLPVQHLGRVEPMDSFARATLATVSGRVTVEGLSAAEWLAELLFDSGAAYKRSVFIVRNPTVRHVLALPERKGNLYAFPEISGAMAARKSMIDALAARKDLDPAQAQLVELYNAMLLYFDVSRSFSLLLPLFAFDDAELAKAMGVTPGARLDYLAMAGKRSAYLDYIRPLLPSLENNADKDGKAMDILQMGSLLQQMDVDRKTSVLRVIPSVWRSDGTWLSPWGLTQEGQGSPEAMVLLRDWGRLGAAYRAGDEKVWQDMAGTIRQRTLALDPDHIRTSAIEAEVLYNRFDPFRCSLVLYMAALAVLIIAIRRDKPILPACALLSGGLFLHAAGIAVRMFILQRPPIATLYESIVFAGFIAVALSLLAGRGKAGATFLLAGSCAGIVLQTIGLAYAADGRSMGTLTAVLNTNFWLATHVVMVTSGYGFCLILGLMAHIDIAQRLFVPASRRTEAILKALTVCSLAALFFAATGTILGGIWADQSWGRFWGWDPKENGALLVVLWLLWLLHGRFSGVLKPLSFTLCAALTVVIVALSWFGVNLLNVGLHSYGFTDNIAVNLGLFVTAELLFTGMGWVVLTQRGKKQA